MPYQSSIAHTIDHPETISRSLTDTRSARSRRRYALAVAAGILVVVIVTLSSGQLFRGSLVDLQIAREEMMEAYIDTAPKDGILSPREMRRALQRIIIALQHAPLNTADHDVNGDAVLNIEDAIELAGTMRLFLQATCGNGSREAGEQCDEGDSNGTACDATERDCAYCSASCSTVRSVTTGWRSFKDISVEQMDTPGALTETVIVRGSLRSVPLVPTRVVIDEKSLWGSMPAPRQQTVEVASDGTFQAKFTNITYYGMMSYTASLRLQLEGADQEVDRKVFEPIAIVHSLPQDVLTAYEGTSAPAALCPATWSSQVKSVMLVPDASVSIGGNASVIRPSTEPHVALRPTGGGILLQEGTSDITLGLANVPTDFARARSIRLTIYSKQANGNDAQNMHYNIPFSESAAGAEVWNDAQLKLTFNVQNNMLTMKHSIAAHGRELWNADGLQTTWYVSAPYTIRTIVLRMEYADAAAAAIEESINRTVAGQAVENMLKPQSSAETTVRGDGSLLFGLSERAPLYSKHEHPSTAQELLFFPTTQGYSHALYRTSSTGLQVATLPITEFISQTVDRLSYLFAKNGAQSTTSFNQRTQIGEPIALQSLFFDYSKTTLVPGVRDDGSRYTVPETDLRHTIPTSLRDVQGCWDIQVPEIDIVHPAPETPIEEGLVCPAHYVQPLVAKIVPTDTISTEGITLSEASSAAGALLEEGKGYIVSKKEDGDWSVLIDVNSLPADATRVEYVHVDINGAAIANENGPIFTRQRADLKVKTETASDRALWQSARIRILGSQETTYELYSKKILVDIVSLDGIPLTESTKLFDYGLPPMPRIALDRLYGYVGYATADRPVVSLTNQQFVDKISGTSGPLTIPDGSFSLSFPDLPADFGAASRVTLKYTSSNGAVPRILFRIEPTSFNLRPFYTLNDAYEYLCIPPLDQMSQYSTSGPKQISCEIPTSHLRPGGSGTELYTLDQFWKDFRLFVYVSSDGSGNDVQLSNLVLDITYYSPDSSVTGTKQLLLKPDQVHDLELMCVT